MYEHQRLLWRSRFNAGGLGFVAALVTAAGAPSGKPAESPAFLAAMGILLVLSFAFARRILMGIETLSFPLLGVLYMLGAIFSFVVLPAGLIVLVAQYAMARRRFHRDMEPNR